MATTRKKRADPLGEHLHMVFPADLVARLDKKVAQMGDERPGVRVTRSDVVRMVLYRFLEEGK